MGGGRKRHESRFPVEYLRYLLSNLPSNFQKLECGVQVLARSRCRNSRNLYQSLCRAGHGFPGRAKRI